MTTTNKPNTLFWVISIVALLWNLAGVAAYMVQKLMTDDMKAAMSEAERTIIDNTPMWYHVAFALAVWFGLLGCIALLLRKKWAKPVFVISLIGIVGQMIYNLFLSGAMDIYGPGAAIMPVLVIIIGIFLIWYAGNCTNKGWLK